MQKWVLYFFFLLLTTSARAQTNLTGVVNVYAPVTAINGDNCVLTLTSAAGFAPGEQALLMQMQGAAFNSTNTASYGNLTALDGAGNFEVVTIQSINGNDITLENGLSRTYNVAGRVQLVSFPDYDEATVIGEVTAQPWDGTTGGVVAIQANTRLTLNANINTTGAGYRGGAVSVNGCQDCFNMSTTNACGQGGHDENNNYFYTSTSVQGGGKGEGIGGILTSQEAGYGKVVNGGGGGNCHNHGGGGGGNIGAGGLGGNRASGCINFCSTPQSNGIGGISLAPQIDAAAPRAFLGGGGGGGHQNNDNSASFPVGNPGWNGSRPGERGGGAVIIRTAELVGNGNEIVANGINAGVPPAMAVEDGGGGGGAGGSILLDVAAYDGTLTCTARGGSGWWTRNDAIGTNNRRLGPGGGGGGGLVWFSQGAAPAGVSSVVAGGAGGQAYRTADGNQFTDPQPHAATDGGAGTLAFDLSLPEAAGDLCDAVLSTRSLRLRALAEGRQVQLHWPTDASLASSGYQVQRAQLGEPFVDIGRVAAAQTTAMSYTDADAPADSRLLYRLRTTTADGYTLYSNRVLVHTDDSHENTRPLMTVYPNPVLGASQVRVMLSQPSVISRVQVLNMQGQVVQVLPAPTTEVSEMAVPLAGLSAGTYLLELVADGRLERTRLLLMGS